MPHSDNPACQICGTIMGIEKEGDDFFTFRCDRDKAIRVLSKPKSMQGSRWEARLKQAARLVQARKEIESRPKFFT